MLNSKPRGFAATSGLGSLAGLKQAIVDTYLGENWKMHADMAPQIMAVQPRFTLGSV